MWNQQQNPGIVLPLTTEMSVNIYLQQGQGVHGNNLARTDIKL